ncbi:MAG: hypothetical protein GW949_02990 [Spirochaetales bacterium]|nr:hypothetical protein [Spirochaetales bacterium]
MKKYSISFLVLLFVFFVSSCNTRVNSLSFSVEGTRELGLYNPGNFVTGIQKDLLLISQSISLKTESYFYVEIPMDKDSPQGRSLVIETFTGAMVEQSKYDSPLSRHFFELPHTNRNEMRSLRLLFRPFQKGFPLPAGGVTIKAFRVSTDIPLLALGLTAENNPQQLIEFTGSRISLLEGTTLDETFVTHALTEEVTSTIEISFDPQKGSEVFLDYDYFPPQGRLTIDPEQSPDLPKARLVLFEPRNGEIASFQTDMRLHPGQQKLSLPATTHGLSPQRLRLTHTELGFTLRGLTVLSIEPEPLKDSPLDPLPAEFGSVLRYPIGAWRQQNYELFSWTIHPKILVIDFRDRNTQKRYLDRLAFFVEKRGFTGTLLTNSQLEGRHAWNAHNYRSQGLADFYNAAESSRFSLNPEEIELRDLISRWGIISRPQAGGQWQPGSGGVVSLTRDPRESVASRALFLTHEGLHGLYYMNPKLVAQAQAEWQNLSSDVRTYLTRYFGYLQYETQDLYLMENEFQAYMLQQPLQEVRWVFGTLYRDRLIRAYPGEEDFFRRTAPIAAGEFFNAAFRLQSLLFEEYGLVGGNLHSLLPIEQE